MDMMHVLNSRQKRNLRKMCEREPLSWSVTSGHDKMACDNLVTLKLAYYQGGTGTNNWHYRPTDFGKSQFALMEALQDE